MTFLLIPTAGPAKVVRQRADMSAFSDAIGGAIPVLAGGTHGIGYVARETFVEEGLDRNAVASTAACLTTARMMPFAGPVAICSLATSIDVNTGKPVGYRAIDMSEADIEIYLTVMEDLRAVHEGRSEDISAKAQAIDGWYGNVRQIMDTVMMCPYPPGWPHPGGSDDVARLFAKLGISVHPEAAS